MEAWLGFQWHGTFNYSTFEREPLGSLDFCSNSSTCAHGIPACNGDVFSTHGGVYSGAGDDPST